MMDKLTCYKRLFEIRDTHHVDVSTYLTKLAASSTIDSSILEFISSYESASTSLNETVVNDIYDRRHKNPLYKSLVNESASNVDKAIALSSYITRVLIASKSLDDVSRHKLLNEMQIHSVSSALSKYSIDDTNAMLSTFDTLRSMIKSIINNNNGKEVR